MLICESCDSGYSSKLSKCRTCGSDSAFAHESNEVSYVDTECYPNYWLCLFSTGECFELYPDSQLDTEALLKTLSHYTIITFNGIGYDMPMIAAACEGKNTTELKRLSDHIINGDVKYWDLPTVPHIDHIDMMNVAPGAGGLKMYGAKMHTKKLQDLPYVPDQNLDWYEIMRVREYCRNDIQVLQELTETLKSANDLRKVISDANGTDVRSKSGPQIAEAVFKKLIGYKIQVPYYQPGIQFYFKPAPWLRFLNLDVLDLVARCSFTIEASGHTSMHDDLANAVIKIGNTEYQMGSGGLHSKEKSIAWHASAIKCLSMFDVASYYPATIINTGIEPPQLKGMFHAIYKGWRDDRMIAKKKAAELKKELDLLKSLP